MSDAGFDYFQRRYLPLNPEEVSDVWIRPGDFFVCRGNGSKHLVGRGTLAQDPPERIIFPDTMMRLRLTDELLRWVSTIWRSGIVRKQIERVAKTTAGIWKISQPNLARITIPVPPTEEQEIAIEAVEGQLSVVEHLNSDIDAKLNSAQVLRQAILSHAFNGRLVPLP
jgi:type I restriction enzyme S subunit